MSEIYKINVLNSNNDITKIFVFHGDKEYKQKDYPANAEPIPMFIYGDDTILRIKEKIFMECGNKIKNPTTSGMYLFSITKKKLNNNNTFFNLTQKETVDLTYNRLRQFLFNIVNNIIHGFTIYFYSINSRVFRN